MSYYVYIMTRSRKRELIHSHNPEMVDYARKTARDPSRRQPPLRMTSRCYREGSRLLKGFFNTLLGDF
jgi:hypothetical protein